MSVGFTSVFHFKLRSSSLKPSTPAQRLSPPMRGQRPGPNGLIYFPRFETDASLMLYTLTVYECLPEFSYTNFAGFVRRMRRVGPDPNRTVCNALRERRPDCRQEKWLFFEVESCPIKIREIFGSILNIWCTVG
ncbi:hypothetical protein EVAR_34532_1 [Eumeta japonica]|uniref:Uncharacterized protein n=1 Tax=Eumeta variegata TaxID=151549 RepID=A0A4C1X5U0_EUMVA|nr:hypothetical protein EVAR_34532_1 [Eumeta japonica]